MRTGVLCFLVCLKFLAFPANAQFIVSGRVTDAERNPLPGISVTLHPKSGADIIAFDVTDDTGNFSILVRSGHDSLRLRVYGLGWAAQERFLRNQPQQLTINLLAKPIALREVRVTPPPVTKRHDTISYSVDAFKNQTDRVIADVIKKLPGIEIETDGRILYQGKPINKYYIEGMDLLENKYRLANDNLPADAVLQVQVIENHQPIRMLDSLVFSDRAALNIRLKNNVTATGTAHMGVGASPLLWDANLTPMLFTHKNQLIASAQANNTGANVSRQLKNISPGTVFNPLQNDDEKKDWLAIQPLSTPAFDEKRWLLNNVQLGSINYLKTLRSDYQIRLNVSYLHDYQQQRGNLRTTYYVPKDTIRLLERDYNQLYFRSLEARLTLQKNSPRRYLKNELLAKGNWDSQRGLIVLNDAPIVQKLSNPFFWLTNKFSDIFKIGTQLLTLESATTFSRTPQLLAVTPGPFAPLINDGNVYQQLTQGVLATSLVMHNSVSMTKKIGRFMLLPELGIHFEKQKLRSSLSYQDQTKSQLLPGLFANNLDWFKLNAFLKLKTQYQKNTWRLDLDMPINYYHFAISDTLANNNQRVDRLIIEPRFSLNKNIGSFWTATGTLSYRNIFGELDDVYYGYLLKTYRTLQRRNVPLQNSQTFLGNVGLSYRNPLTATFGSVFYSYSLSRNNLLYQSQITSTGATEYSAIVQFNNSSVQLLTGQLSQFVKPLKTTVSTRLSWSTMARNQLVNGALINVNNQTISPNISLSTNFKKIVDLNYDYKLTLFTTQLSLAGDQRTSQQKHALNLSIYFNQKSYLIVENELYKNSLTDKTISNYFTNILFRYAIPHRKMDLETACTNLWNTASLTTGSLTSFSYIESVYELRPRQIVQKIRFSF